MPDVAVLFSTAPHAGALEDIARGVRQLLNPRVLIGVTAMGVVGGAREVEDVPAISLWAGRWEVDVEPLRLEAFDAPDGMVLAGATTLPGREGTLLLLADPYSFPIDGVLQQLAEHAPGMAVIGGLASGARGPGGNVLLLDDEQFRDGAVGVWLPPSVPVVPVVSQGCRPFGQPLVVTRSERNMIYELAGQPALDRLMAQIADLDPTERALAAQGLHVGIVRDEHLGEFDRGDFLVRAVMGADRTAGAVAVGAEVEVGQTVQFHLRDAASAHDDLVAVLGRQSDADLRATGALVFTCTGRGRQLFGEPDHDATLVSEAVPGAAVAGMFCAGELGPVAGHNFVHGFTASVALVGDPPGRPLGRRH
jgi:small ligand-binding sensory domain FIST